MRKVDRWGESFSDTARSQNRLMYSSYLSHGSNGPSLATVPSDEKKPNRPWEAAGTRLPFFLKTLTRPFVATTMFFGPAAIGTSGGNCPVSVTPPNEPPKNGALGARAVPEGVAVVALAPELRVTAEADGKGWGVRARCRHSAWA